MPAQRIRRQRGFTLIEILIASTLMMLAMGMTMSFLAGFNRTSNRTIISSTMQEQLRSALNRLEKEMAGAAEVVAHREINGTPYDTDENTLIFSVPLYTSTGFVAVDSNGNPIRDTFLLEVVDDMRSTTSVLHERSPVRRPRMLQLTVDPNASSTRIALNKQVLATNLMPEHTASKHYDCPAADNACPAPTSTPDLDQGYPGGAGAFTLVKRDGNEVLPSDTSSYNLISGVKILLRGEQEDGAAVIRSHKEFEIRLRNWRPAATPTPTPTP